MFITRTVHVGLKDTVFLWTAGGMEHVTPPTRGLVDLLATVDDTEDALPAWR